MRCPECSRDNLKKDGYAIIRKDRQATRKQRWLCTGCGLHTTKPIDNPSKLTCLRCGHQWASKNEHPKHCPKCGAAYWDRPRKDAHNVNIAEPSKEALTSS